MPLFYNFGIILYNKNKQIFEKMTAKICKIKKAKSISKILSNTSIN